MAELSPGADAPVVPVTPASTDAPAPDPTAGQPAAEAPPVVPEPEKMLTQAEVNKLMGKVRAQESRRADRLADERAARLFAERELQRERESRQPQAQQGEPQQKDFQDYEEYLLARAEYRFEQKLAKQRDESQRQTQTSQQQREQQERARYIQETVVAKGRAEFEDFDEVVSSDGVSITEPMLAAASKLKNGAAVLYHIGQNAAESHRIAQLSGVEQAWEMKDLGSKLSAPPKPTQTPPPIVPNEGTARVRKDWADLSTAEHVDKWLRRKQR